MTGLATRYGAMIPELRLWVTVAVEAKTVKPRLNSHLEICTGAAMAMNAGVEAAAIGIVMVAA